MGVNEIQRIPVQSSNLKSVGYDEKRSTLEVEFLDKSIYRYSRVPKYRHEELLNAKSKGRYFSRYIRDNKDYSCTQIYPKYSERRR